MPEEAVKSIHTFKIIDGVIKETYFEKHYMTKLDAKSDENVIVNKRVKDNIVSGQLESSLDAISRNAYEFYKELKNTYSNIGIVYIDI